MTERRCENCRWWSAVPTGYGYCHRRPPIVSDSDECFPSTHKSCWCGEWSDASITPEQEDRQKLTRQILLAMTESEWCASCSYNDMWKIAGKLAAAEPQIQRENEQ
jgi:hypothetical protein